METMKNDLMLHNCSRMIGVIYRENSRKKSNAFWLFFVKIQGRQAKPFCREN